MNTTNKPEIEIYFANEITRLNFKSIVIKSACKKFQLTKEEAEILYCEVRKSLKKSLGKRAWTYLLIGGVFFGVGLFGTLSKTGFVFYGAIAVGAGLLLTAIGYFRVSMLKD